MTLEPSAKRARPEPLAPEKAHIAHLVRSVHGEVPQSPASTSATLIPAVAAPSAAREGASASAPAPSGLSQHAAHQVLVGAHRSLPKSSRSTEEAAPAPGAAAVPGRGLQLRLDPPTADARASGASSPGPSSRDLAFLAFKQDYAALQAIVSAGERDVSQAPGFRALSHCHPPPSLAQSSSSTPRTAARRRRPTPKGRSTTDRSTPAVWMRPRRSGTSW